VSKERSVNPVEGRHQWDAATKFKPPTWTRHGLWGDVTVHSRASAQVGTIGPDHGRLREILVTALPELCLVVIIGHLDLRDVGHLAMAHRVFASITREYLPCWAPCRLGDLSLTDNLLAQLGRRLTHIEVVVPMDEGDRSVTDVGLQTLAKYANGLRAVSIANCRDVTDVGVECLVQVSPRLLVMSLKNCRRVTDIGVAAVATHCHQLKTLSLMGCRDLTNVGMTELSHLRQLR
jgi:hypothetical protein